MTVVPARQPFSRTLISTLCGVGALTAAHASPDSGYAPRIVSSIDTTPMSHEDMIEFRNAFDRETLESLFGEGASLSTLADIDRKSVTGPRPYDIYVNGVQRERIVVNVAFEHGRYSARLPASILLRLPFDPKNPDLPEELRMLSPEENVPIERLGELLPGTTATLSTLSQEIRLEIPESWFTHSSGRIMPTNAWDWGEDALVANYDLNAQHSSYGGVDREHLYASTDLRLNLGVWRLVGGAYWSVDRDASEGTTRDTLERRNLYATRVFGDASNRLKVGEFSTSTYFTPGVQIRGAELRLDPSMLDSSTLNFVPVVTGTADTQARVTVRQRGRLIYERYVAPGSFMLENLPNLSASGDLEVTVEEADGRVRTFTVPFTSNGRQLRTGKVRWSIAAGLYDGGFLESDRPAVVNLDAGWGGPFNTTFYGGGLVTDSFHNARAGMALMIPMAGALNLEWIHSSDRTDNPYGSGHGAAVGFTRYVEKTGSYVNLRYERTISGVLTRIEEAYARREAMEPFGITVEDSVLQASVSQHFGRFGSLSLSFNRRTEAEGDHTTDLSASYTTSWKRMNINVSLQQSRLHHRYGANEKDFLASVNVTIPLSAFFGREAYSSHTVGLGFSRDDEGRTTRRASITGTALEDHRLSYSLQTSSATESDTGFYGSLHYRANRAELGLMASTEGGDYSFTASASGAVVGLRQGVLFTNEINGPTVLALFPDVPEARLLYQTVTTAVDGGIVATGLSNYEENELHVDVDRLPTNVAMPLYVRHVVPADDAIIVVPFETFRGKQLYAHFSTPDGAPPFGSYVRLLGDAAIPIEGMVDEAGSVYFPAVPEDGVFEVSWRDERGNPLACRAPFVSPAARGKGVERMDLTCEPIDPSRAESTDATGTTTLENFQ